MTDLTSANVTLANVDLTNCAQEPIHIPGFVQPHGVLLAFDLKGTLSHRCANATELIPGLLAAEAVIAPGFWAQNHALRDAFEGVQEDVASGEDVPTFASELKIDGRLFDVVMYAFDRRIVIEFKRRPAGKKHLRRLHCWHTVPRGASGAAKVSTPSWTKQSPPFAN